MKPLLSDDSNSDSSDDDDNGKSQRQKQEEEQKATALKVNKRYARAYQERKQREELRAVKFSLDDADDASTSSSSSEDEDGTAWDPAVDVQIVRTVNALRSRDAAVYDGKTRFFEHEQENATSSADEDESTSKKKKSKRKSYNDVVREQVLKSNPEQEEEEEQRDYYYDDGPMPTSRLAYDQEQRDLRRAFLQKTDDSPSEKNKSGVSGKDDEGDDDRLLVVKTAASTFKVDPAVQKQLDTEFTKLAASKQQPFVDPRGEVTDGSSYLLNYFKNRAWVDPDEAGSLDSDDDNEQSDANEEAIGTRSTGDSDPSGDGKSENELRRANFSDEDSLEDLEQADNFESQYNLRFEQAAAATTGSGERWSNRTYARGVATVRRTDTTRRDRREARRERKTAERKAKEEELRRLKNAKRMEMEGKLQQIRAVLGETPDGGEAVDEATLMQLLEGDFDPEKFEALMNDAYGDEYYSNNETQWSNDQDVRACLKKDEGGDVLVGQDDVDGSLYDTGENELPGDQDAIQGYHNAEDEEEWVEEEEADDVDMSSKQDTALEKKIKTRMTEELYKLDYEDIVAGMPTRFKYRAVEKNDYGLSTEEVLFARDTTLKQFVSLKKMAPYREEGEFYTDSRRRRRFRENFKNDLIADSTVTGATPVKDKVDETESGDAPKKKRRRKRSSKSKSREAVDAKPMGDREAVGNVKGHIESKPVGEDSLDDRPTKKRARRRKHKKDKKESTNVAATSEETVAQPSVSISSKEAEKQTTDKSKKRSKSRNKEKGSKKITKPVGDMSSSRLAAYGI